MIYRIKDRLKKKWLIMKIKLMRKIIKMLKAMIALKNKIWIYKKFLKLKKIKDKILIKKTRIVN